MYTCTKRTIQGTYKKNTPLHRVISPPPPPPQPALPEPAIALALPLIERQLNHHSNQLSLVTAILHFLSSLAITTRDCQKEKEVTLLPQPRSPASASATEEQEEEEEVYTSEQVFL